MRISTSRFGLVARAHWQQCAEMNGRRLFRKVQSPAYRFSEIYDGLFGETQTAFLLTYPAQYQDHRLQGHAQKKAKTLHQHL